MNIGNIPNPSPTMRATTTIPVFKPARSQSKDIVPTPINKNVVGYLFAEAVIFIASGFSSDRALRIISTNQRVILLKKQCKKKG